MTTLADTALTVATMLGRVDNAGTTITDLEAEIKDEIRNAIRHYNRKPSHLIESRLVRFVTEPGQGWYSAGDIWEENEDVGVSISGELGEGVIVVDTASADEVSFTDVLNIDYIRETTSSLEDGLRHFPFREFQRLFEGGAVGGIPYAYSRYGGKIGIYPKPQAVYTIEFAATVKPQIPTVDTAQSVWFDQANELIEASAAGRVCLKHLRDAARAQEFAAITQPLEAALHEEYVRKSSTGRVKPHG